MSLTHKHGSRMHELSMLEWPHRVLPWERESQENLAEKECVCLSLSFENHQ